MLSRANYFADLAISFPFRSWMLFSLMRLPFRKWTEYLKEMGRRFPHDLEEYRHMQSSIVREKTLEAQVGNMHLDRGSHTTSPGAGIYFADSIPEPVPLFLCLGSPCGDSLAITAFLAGTDTGASGVESSQYLPGADGLYHGVRRPRAGRGL